ncbi:MAG: hypothetical protein A2007_00170 [Verrucomicrobia bacterium GWC2_42_7]|nr:MAG: hypothetical protein A2007_00170 [Verrucomicrobia bacterium GWC2_42_7]
MGTQLTGLVNGIDWQSMLDQYVSGLSVPKTKLQTEQTTARAKTTSLGELNSSLSALKSAAQALKQNSVFGGRTTSLKNGNTTPVVSAEAEPNTIVGSYQFKITSLATKSVRTGASSIAKPIHSTSDVSAVTLSSMSLNSPITAGNFTVNGATITIATSDSLQSVFNKISLATGGTVSARYNPTSDKISLSSTSAIVIGTAGDTSNFLSAVKLFSNGTSSISSGSKLGAVSMSNALTSSNLASSLSDNKVTAGTLSVNGKTVTIDTTDTLKNVFDKISAATGGVVTASYDSAKDKITLTGQGSDPIVLGSSSDTSNFLSAAKLSGNNTNTVSSSNTIGGVNEDTQLQSNNMVTQDGAFTINGVRFNFQSGQSMGYLMSQINLSSAGVNISYDNTNDRFVLTSKNTGSLDVSVSDISGGLLNKMGLTAPTTTLGENATFYIGDSNIAMTSQSNNLTASVHGISGLTVSALKTGTETVAVDQSTTGAQSAIQGFIDAYNKVQTYIDTNTSIKKDASGKVTPAQFATNDDIKSIARALRAKVFDTVPGLTGSVQRLADMGIDFSSTSSQLQIKDQSKLTKALKQNPAGVTTLFTDENNGLGAVIEKYTTQLTKQDSTNASSRGTLQVITDSYQAQVKSLQKQIDATQLYIDNQKEAMQTSLFKMQEAMQKLNQQTTQLNNFISSLS